MILLIIGVGMLNFLLPAPLNSIMFLLIPSKSLAPHAIFPAFKFHYVSINSLSDIWASIRERNFKFHYVSINSR